MRVLTSGSGGEVDLAHAEEAVAGVGVGEVRPEEAPGAEVTRLRQLAGVVARRNSGSVVAQGPVCGGAAGSRL